MTYTRFVNGYGNEEWLMGKRRFTEHKLTDAQLRSLCQIIHGGTYTHRVASLSTLSLKGLVVFTLSPYSYQATPSGGTALAQARAEGW